MGWRPGLLTTQRDQTEQDDDTFGHDSTLTQIPKALFGFFSRKPTRLATQKPDAFAIRVHLAPWLKGAHPCAAPLDRGPSRSAAHRKCQSPRQDRCGRGPPALRGRCADVSG